MKQEVFNKILEKAAKKEKDGVYTYEGKYYAVINKKLVLVGDFKIYFRFSSGFLVNIGTCNHWKMKDKIKELFKKLKT